MFNGCKIYILISSLFLFFNTAIDHKCYGQTKTAFVTVRASEKYSPASALRIIFIGENYRKEWNEPVTIPVFDLAKVNGGFTIIDSGGGRQTNNLRLKDKSGADWTLRSVDKDVEKAIFPFLRNTMAETLMQDLQSAIHPYAALTVPTLAKAVGVTVAQPKLYFIPDDPAFGEYRSVFANTVCFLEEREPTPDNSETKSSNTVLEKVSTEDDHRLMQIEILKARLLDMLIGDWDRHEDQWRWGVNDSSGVHYYYPIPRDRDFAYFNSNGLFIKLASRLSVPYMKGFSRNAAGLQRLNAKVLSLDMYWLNELSRHDWEETIDFFENRITDSIIVAAVRHLPTEVHRLSGEELVTKLVARRNSLKKHGMKYYEVLAVRPVITGTDEKELYVISRHENGIRISAWQKTSKGKDVLLYRRSFSERDTKQIRIEGMGGDDEFKVDENVSSSIKLYLDGGQGDDLYAVRGKIRTRTEEHRKMTSNRSGLARK